jgi:predicted nucleic acid-binding Zn ribbon protein
MPAFTFICDNCGVTKIVTAELNAQIDAPYCGLCELDMRRMFKVGAVNFKGGGWGSSQ